MRVEAETLKGAFMNSADFSCDRREWPLLPPVPFRGLSLGPRLAAAGPPGAAQTRCVTGVHSFIWGPVDSGREGVRSLHSERTVSWKRQGPQFSGIFWLV